MKQLTDDNLQPPQLRTPGMLDWLEYERAEGITAPVSGRQLVIDRYAQYDDGRRRIDALSQPPLPPHQVNVAHGTPSVRRESDPTTMLALVLCVTVLFWGTGLLVLLSIIVRWL